MDEEFRNVLEGYEVSSIGNCRRKLKSGLYKSLKGSIHTEGYRYFQLKRGGKRKNYFFHVLVARAFLGERPFRMVVDHVNRNKEDNCVSNLRYVTVRENTLNSSRFDKVLTFV